MGRFFHILGAWVVVTAILPVQGMVTLPSPASSTPTTQWTAALQAYHTLFNTTVSLKQSMRTCLTPTLAHLYVTRAYIEEYSKRKELQEFVQKIIEKEISCLDEDEEYYSYFHAHKWYLDLAQRIYAELCPVKNKEFFPLHFLTCIKPPADEQALIKILQEKGNSGYDSLTEGEKYLLSVNTAFFGNNSSWGESTANYFYANISIAAPDLSLATVLNNLGYGDLYKKYESEFHQLKELHKIASPYGKLWLIKIPKKVHKNIVIATQAYGYKTKFIIDNKETDDVDYIQDTLRTRPDAIKDIDTMQFRIIMTPSTGLNQDLGIKTIPLHCADPVKYAEFEKMFTTLMAQIKADTAAPEKASAH